MARFGTRRGATGPPGTDIHFIGSVADAASLPAGAASNDAYIVDADGNLYVSNGNEVWTDAGQIVGPDGPQGPAGPSVTGATGPPGADGSYESMLLLETAIRTSNHTATLEDVGKVVPMNGTTLTLFIPLESQVNFPIGSVIYAYDMGAATFTVSGVAGVIVRNGGTVPQFQTVTIRKRAANEWVMQL